MGDVKEGPYKVVAKLRRGGVVEAYSIAVEQKSGYLKELVPDAGEAQTARDICNLLNKKHADVLRQLETGEGWGENVEADGTASAGVPSSGI